MPIKQITKNIYTIDCHPYPDKVYRWIRENWDMADYQTSDMLDSLKAFCRHFELDLDDYRLSGYRPDSYIKVSGPELVNEMTGEPVRGVRLWTWLHNSGALTAGKDKSLLDGDCPFTGLCYDEWLLDDIRAFVAAPDQTTTLHDLINRSLERFRRMVSESIEYLHSDDSIYDSCMANDYYFYESGAIA